MYVHIWLWAIQLFVSCPIGGRTHIGAHESLSYFFFVHVTSLDIFVVESTQSGSSNDHGDFAPTRVCFLSIPHIASHCTHIIFGRSQVPQRFKYSYTQHWTFCSTMSPHAKCWAGSDLRKRRAQDWDSLALCYLPYSTLRRTVQPAVPSNT